jgi:cytoskeletal protein CcmA (bactofilin family)
MMVDGEVTGNIKTLGNLTIGVNALINGHVSGFDVRVSGSLQGNISAEGEASISESGNVLGDITCNTISIGSGAVFRGRIQMQINPTLNLEEQGSDRHDQPRNRG